MRDIWGFLLQTLNVSGVAALLLLTKALFRDKLSPRWQFSIWVILAMTLVIPAGFLRRYTLFNWSFYIEAVKTALTGNYSLTSVVAPIPLPIFVAPKSVWDWLYVLYSLVVVGFLLRYIVSYFLLRRSLKMNTPASAEYQEQIQRVAEKYGLPLCPAVEVDGIYSAFICGVFSPKLVIPAGVQVDDKVLLHELLHLKYHDAVWELLICFFRCLHWCNPLIWYCANTAENDLEALCDQRVLKRLEGEDRRDYGRLLLATANKKYARIPGTSSIANGGKNIRRRVESIARFNRYPAGMGLASVCVALVLCCPVFLGQRSGAVRLPKNYRTEFDLAVSMASARTTRCTTCAGAMDTYAKAVLTQNGIYRALCAPLSEHASLAVQLCTSDGGYWDSGLSCTPLTSIGYNIYNLRKEGNGYVGLLCVAVLPTSQMQNENENEIGTYAAYQWIQAKREGDSWVVEPLGEFQVKFEQGWYNSLPSEPSEDVSHSLTRYEASAMDFTVCVNVSTSWQVKSYTVSSNPWGISNQSFDTTPQPDGEFTGLYMTHLTLIYTGDEADKANINHVGVSYSPWSTDSRRPSIKPSTGTASGSSSSGDSFTGTNLAPGWKNTLLMGGRGSSIESLSDLDTILPEAYAADLYINNKLAAELTLLPVEE